MAVVQLSLDQICRGCLSRDNLQPLSKSQRIEVLAECINLTISLTDGLPTNICSDCWEQCTKWSFFKQQCRKTDATLRGLLLFKPEEIEDDDMEEDKFAEEILTELDDDALGEELDIEILPMAPLKGTALMSIIEPVALAVSETTTSPVPTPIEVDEKKSSCSLTCKYCEKKFRKENMLEAHERAHEGKKPFVCKICETEFNTRLTLRNHMFKHSDAKYECPDCGRLFNYPQLMEEHRKRMHTVQEKSFVCDICGKDFSRAQTLQVHMLTHTDVKPMECDVCHMRFKSEVYLKIHQVRHSKVKSYECAEEDCKKAFYTKSELNFHRRSVHTDDKPHSCKHCDKRYTKKSQLETHLKIHTGARKIKCSRCSATFATPKKLNKHVESAHSKESFKCEHCSKEFRLKHTYNTHLKTHNV